LIQIISDRIDATSVQAFWIGTSFQLCSAVFQPIFASFSIIFGRKSIVFIALTLFTVGTIISGVAHVVSVIILGRCLQGAGGGGLITLTYVLIADLFSLRERGKWFGFIGLVWLLGSVTGPIMGGGFAQNASWVS
jgi:MFS family permease